MSDIKAIIFDFDGTMVDSFAVWNEVINPEFCAKWSKGIYKKTMDIDAEAKALKGISFTSATEFFMKEYNLNGTLEELVEERSKVALHHFKHTVKMSPGVKEFIDNAAIKGIKLAIASSNSHDVICACLEGNGLRDSFKTIFTTCNVQRPKPFPDVFLKTAEELGVSPEECLVFEDALEGVLAGKAAGMKVFGVYYKHHTNYEEDIKENCDRYINDFTEVLDLFDTEMAV